MYRLLQLHILRHLRTNYVMRTVINNASIRLYNLTLIFIQKKKKYCAGIVSLHIIF
jgi:hypothetical protein